MLTRKSQGHRLCTNPYFDSKTHMKNKSPEIGDSWHQGKETFPRNNTWYQARFGLVLKRAVQIVLILIGLGAAVQLFMTLFGLIP